MGKASHRRVAFINDSPSAVNRLFTSVRKDAANTKGRDTP